MLWDKYAIVMITSLFFFIIIFFFYRCFSWRKENQGIRHTAGICFAKEVYKSTALYYALSQKNFNAQHTNDTAP